MAPSPSPISSRRNHIANHPSALQETEPLSPIPGKVAQPGQFGGNNVYDTAFRNGYAAALNNHTTVTPLPGVPENSTMEGVYVVAVLAIYAVSIAFMIGFMSMKKNNNLTWDKEAAGYLQGIYTRRRLEEKRKLCSLTAALGPLPSLLLPGMAAGIAGMKGSAFAPTNVAAAIGQPVIGKQWTRRDLGKHLATVHENPRKEPLVEDTGEGVDVGGGFGTGRATTSAAGGGIECPGEANMEVFSTDKQASPEEGMRLLDNTSPAQ